MEDIQFWPGREGSPDPRGWYVNDRDDAGNILDVRGPYLSRAEAFAGARETGKD